MPTAEIADGVVLHYEDSGPPGGAPDYTTYLLIHGYGVNGGKHLLRLL